jgi:ActR/RegA family two-component response regulator
LQLDEAKTPARPFAVRCPKCQTNLNVQPNGEVLAASTSDQLPPSPEAALRNPDPAFERPATAPRFQSRENESIISNPNETTSGLSDIAKLLAEALNQSTGNAGTSRKRPAWDRRKVLVCASPAYREAIAESLTTQDYDVFMAENMAQGLGRMREERMDVIILDANFDPLEQGVAFITREVRLLRPSERRRLFFVLVTSGVRTMDLHAAFLHNVNLVVNPSDVEQLPEALGVSIRHYNELYRPFNRALDIAPI